MEAFSHSVLYFLSFKTFVVLPVIIFTLAVIFRIKTSIALKSGLLIGIGFFGIMMVFDVFVKTIGPVIEALITRLGLHYNVLDAGWPPLAAITWSFKLAPVLLVVFLIANILMLVLKMTRTVNIDIWNYWHVILGAAMIYNTTGNAFLTIVISLIAFIIVLKLAEWSAPLVNKFSGMKGICTPHLAALSYYPFALLGNVLMDKIPGLNKIDANPERIQKKIGIIGEPFMLGLVLGTILGIGAGYDIKKISEIAVSFAAVIYILPKMCSILGTALLPVSEGMKEFINRHFPDMGETFIGIDVAILFGIPSVIVSALVLIPVSIVLALLLPGINFIPLGDLTNLMVPVAYICVATKGNLIRSFILGVPMVIANLYVASSLAPTFTNMAAKANYKVSGYKGMFTSFLDGGNFFRAWFYHIASGQLLAMFLIPVGVIILYFTWKFSKQENDRLVYNNTINQLSE